MAIIGRNCAINFNHHFPFTLKYMHLRREHGDTDTCTHKWACSNVIVIIATFEWWGEGASYWQDLWISHTSFASSFDHSWAALIGLCLSICFLCILDTTSTVLFFSSLPWCLPSDPITLHNTNYKEPPVTHYCLSPNVLFLVNLSYRFLPLADRYML